MEHVKIFFGRRVCSLSWHLIDVQTFVVGVLGIQVNPEIEPKVLRLMELGFDRESVTQALTLFGGNEEQAASYLFGG